MVLYRLVTVSRGWGGGGTTPLRGETLLTATWRPIGSWQLLATHQWDPCILCAHTVSAFEVQHSFVLLYLHTLQCISLFTLQGGNKVQRSDGTGRKYLGGGEGEGGVVVRQWKVKTKTVECGWRVVDACVLCYIFAYRRLAVASRGTTKQKLFLFFSLQYNMCFLNIRPAICLQFWIIVVYCIIKNYWICFLLIKWEPIVMNLDSNVLLEPTLHSSNYYHVRQSLYPLGKRVAFRFNSSPEATKLINLSL